MLRKIFELTSHEMRVLLSKSFARLVVNLGGSRETAFCTDPFSALKPFCCRESEVVAVFGM
jgi:hypothetical protein